MIGLPDIRSVDRPTAGQVVLELVLPEDSPAFDGHFPGQPILPGVVQLDWALRLAEAYLVSVPPVARDFQVKFRRPLRPGALIHLVLTLNSEKRYLAFEYRFLDDVASTGRIKLEVA